MHSGQNKVMTAEALIFRMLRLILQHGKREGGGLYTYLILHTYKNLGCLDQIRCVVSFFLNFQGWDDDDEVFGRRRSRIFFLHFFHSFSWIHVWQVGCNVVVKCLDWKSFRPQSRIICLLSLMIKQLGRTVNITKISARENVSIIFFGLDLVMYSYIVMWF